MHDLRVCEGIFGVGPPFLHAKHRVAADLFLIGAEELVVEVLELGCCGSLPAVEHARQRGVGEDAAAEHHVARLRIRPE